MTKKAYLIIIHIAISILLLTAAAAGENLNPFLNPGDGGSNVKSQPSPKVQQQETPNKETKMVQAQPKKSNWLFYNLSKAQKKMNSIVSSKIKRLKEEKSIGFFFSIMLICFIYGIAHALGPGHGKTVIGSWILISRRELREVISVSILTAAIHSLSATLLVLGSWYILKNALSIEAETIKSYLFLGSGVLLFFLGVYELYRYFKTQKLKSLNKENSAEEGNKESTGKETDGGHSGWNSLTVALTVGIVPCPVTSVILIFSISMGLLWQGILFVIAFALGMSAAILGVSGIIWKMKEKASQTKMPALNYVVDKVFPVIGGLALILFSILILLSYQG